MPHTKITKQKSVILQAMVIQAPGKHPDHWIKCAPAMDDGAPQDAEWEAGHGQTSLQCFLIIFKGILGLNYQVLGNQSQVQSSNCF